MDPIFVIGYKRSGTTLLRLMLNAHPAIAIPPESEYFQKVPRALGRSRVHCVAEAGSIADRLAGLKRCDFGLRLTSGEIRSALLGVLPGPTSAVVARLYVLWAERTGKPEARWGDKKPRHWKLMNGLRRWYPNAQFVHIVRDPRDVVASIERRLPEQVRGRWLIDGRLISAWQWRACNKEAMRQGTILGPERYHRIRYEDLVHDPETCMRTLCRFLSVPFSPDMLKHHENELSGFQEATERGGIHEDTTRPVHAGAVGRFRETLGERGSRAVSWVCRDLAPAAARPSLGTRLRLRALCRGLDGAWWLRRLGDRARGGL